MSDRRKIDRRIDSRHRPFLERRQNDRRIMHRRKWGDRRSGTPRRTI